MIPKDLTVLDFHHKHGSQRPNTAKLVVAPMSVEKAVLDKGIEPVRPAVLTGMCRERKVELSNHLIPTFCGMIGKDLKKSKSCATIQLLGKDENTGWDGGCTRS